MSETKLATKADLQDMYQRILPYLGGFADAGFTPVGTVISVMGKTAPANYLACDGTVYNISDYPELANYFLQQFEAKNYFGGDGTTTFAVPDLRGEFLRGTGTNSHENQGSGADVGTHNDATIHPFFAPDARTSNKESITFRLPTNDPQTEFNPTNYKNYVQPYKADVQLRNSSSNDYGAKTKILDVKPSSISEWGGSNPYGYTSRPTNTSVLYCIATKNIYLNPSLDYSTDEKVVGTWIDGKPLYQKTIPFTVPTPTINGVAVIENIPNSELSDLADVIYLEGYYTDSSNALFNFVDKATSSLSEPAFQTTCISIYYAKQQNGFVISCSLLSHGGRTGHITVRYTKTT